MVSRGVFVGSLMYNHLRNRSTFLSFFVTMVTTCWTAHAHKIRVRIQSFVCKKRTVHQNRNKYVLCRRLLLHLVISKSEYRLELEPWNCELRSKYLLRNTRKSLLNLTGCKSMKEKPQPLHFPSFFRVGQWYCLERFTSVCFSFECFYLQYNSTLFLDSCTITMLQE